ncbi:MAG: ATP-binding protein [Halobacteriales archaeon]|nr:ATP-binding protein [Halobacteriales archaeon]
MEQRALAPTDARPAPMQRIYTIKVLGRTLTHLGTQMYKRREAAIAELVANSWDAGARKVRIFIPETAYSAAKSEIVIEDNGHGMTPDQVQDDYLVVARNRRKGGKDTVDAVLEDFIDDADADEEVPAGDEAPADPDQGDQASTAPRPIMGRKGIGKLAGFGLAKRVRVRTWTGGQSVTFEIDGASLEAGDNEAKDFSFTGTLGDAKGESTPSGTRVVLSGLKHKTPLDKERLRQSLARRFSRRVRGQMEITVNGTPLEDPTPTLRLRHPPQGMVEETLEDGNTVRYWYGFAESSIGAREQRGFTIMVRGRTAQSPPYFFDVEGTATGQHSTRYVVGDIEADYLDKSIDADDVISTDRQEVDWDDESVKALKAWGEKLARKCLADCAKKMGEDLHNALLEDADFKGRLDRLDDSSRKRATQFLILLGQNRERVDDSTRGLADRVLQAFEYRHFHDVIGELEEAVKEDPAQLETILTALDQWSVIEGRAMHEIMEGRLFIIDKFRAMILEGAPETAPAVGISNMHDLLARFPWLLRPRWTVIREEKSVSKTLKEWASKDDGGNPLERYDFLALESESLLVVIEIKAPGHAVAYTEVERLDRYQERLAKGLAKPVKAVLVHGGTLDLSPQKMEELKARRDLTLLTWGELFAEARSHYAPFAGIVSGDAQSPESAALASDLAEIREVKRTGSVYRGTEARKEAREKSA